MDIRQPVPVVILCGGKGSRLKEETEFRPKPMVTVGGMPILWHIMKGYAHFGYNHFVLCLGYKGHMIKDYFLNHRLYTSDVHFDSACGHTMIQERPGRDDFKITFVETGEDTQTSERLKIAGKYITAPQFMLTYGDGVSDVDVRALHAFHNERTLQNGALMTLTGVHPRSKYGLVETNDQKMVTTFRQKPILSDFTNGGFMVMNREFLERTRENEMVEDTIIRAAEDRKVALYHHEGFWHCMDTYQDMEELNKQWKDDPKWCLWGK